MSFKIINDIKAGSLSGKAFAKMQKGNYRDAAILLRKICLDNPDFENSEYLYYCLGQCHYNLGQLKTAIKWLSKSYDMYRTGVQKNNSQRYISSSRAALELYCKVLRIDGNTALADSIMNKHDWS